MGRQKRPRLTISSGGDGLTRALQLARSGCSDAEIAAVLSYETDLEAADVDAMIADPDLVERLERSRLAGRAFFRDYVFQAATPPEPTAATLQLAAWLSRQTLGFTTGGMDESVKGAADRYDRMSNEELAAEFRAKADVLDPPRKAADA